MLPMPPSVNAYWADRIIFNKKQQRHMAARYVTHDGKHYVEDIKTRIMDMRARFFTKAHLSMMMVLCFRDARANDLDNRVKSFQDALKEAGVYEDDKQIKLVQVIEGPIIKEGRVLLFLSEVQIDTERLLADALSVKYIAGHQPIREVVTPKQSGDLFQDEVSSETRVRRSARRAIERQRASQSGGTS